MAKTIAVDFDGVIHEYDGFRDGSCYGKPIAGAKETMERLVKSGKRIVIFTTRLSPEFDEQNEKDGRDMRGLIIEWLAKNGFHIGVHWHELTGYKPAAIAYIDDRAIRFTHWRDIRNYFM